MSFGNYPAKYLLFNQRLSKQLSIVVKIDGIPFLFGIADTFTQIRYGDPGIVYGEPGVVYGGLRSLSGVLPIIQLDSNLTIQQRIEPEQGIGNIGNIVLSFIDLNGIMSKVVTPGFYVPEIMGRLCTVYIGFTQTSFPEDFVILYRGNVTQIQAPQGVIKLTVSDSMNKQRQPIFNMATTKLATPLAATGSPVTVNMDNTGVLHKQILGPNGQYDPTVQTYLVIDSEIFQYGPTGIIDGNNVLCTRPVLGTQASAHSAGASILGTVGFGFQPASGFQPAGIHPIDFALKIMLSGWNGPCLTGVPLLSFVYNYNGGFASNEFVLAASGFNVNDAFLDLGLTIGDSFQVSGSSNGNNLSGQITGILPGANGSNVIIQTNRTFTLENPTSATVAFRSQYDTFPITCGVQMATTQVDVSTFQQMKATYFTSGIFVLRSYYDSPVMGSALIAKDIMLPIGSYSISRYGRSSMAVTKPPLPGAGTKMVQLDFTNVLDPDKIMVTRAINLRSFYNNISYEFDFDVATGAFGSIQYFFDTTSAAHFDDVENLPIQAKSVSSALGGATLASERGAALLNRFKQCLIWIELTVNWSVGSLIEVSDIVVLVDNGNLKIMNFATGERNLGVELFEVIDRDYQIVSGNVKLKLLGGLGFDVDSRFGLYSPSTVLGAGSTPSMLKLTPSYGQTLVSAERAKWVPLIGMPIQVHDYFYSVTGASVILGVDPLDVTALDIAPPLPFAVSAGMILDIAPYPTDTNPKTDQILKKLYAHFTPTIGVAAGVSPTQFNVAASGVPLLVVGNTVILRNGDYSSQSPEVAVQSVSGSLVTVAKSLGFTPTTGYVVEGIGYKDHLSFYRYG